ncbi:MAG: transporter substrate-binding domain-containing protein [Pseudomonadota bacterium]
MGKRKRQLPSRIPRRIVQTPSSRLSFIGLALVAIVLMGLGPNAGHAQDVQQPAPQASQAVTTPLKVGTKIAPPFVIQADDGSWSGISIDLLRRIALRLNREFEVQAFDTPGAIVEAAARNNVDVGIAALSVTGEREQITDFSHPYYQSGLKVAVPRKSGSEWMNLLRALSSGPFLATVGMLALLLFATGAVMWMIERRHNSEHFPEDPIEGVGSGFWWSAVTMTTVGYGDKAPITFLGRAIAVVWMFAALILTAVFTAQLTSALTIERIAGPVQNISDLATARVGILENSATRTYFAERRQFAAEYPTVKDGLEALRNGRIDAFVHDAPILSFKISQGFSRDLKTLPDLFEVQNYAAVLPPGSPLREDFNQALLEITASDLWPTIQAKYLGE